MSNYATLKQAIQSAIRTNGNEEITGAVLQNALLSIIDSIGANYTFAGVATPQTNAGAPDQNVFYIGGAGTYTNFGTTVTVPVGSICVFKYNGSWANEQVILYAGIDDVPTAGSNNLVKSGGVAEVLSKDIDITNDLIIGALAGYIERNGIITAYATWHYKTLLLKKGQTITVVAATGNYPKLGIAQSGTVEVGDVVTVVSGDTFTASSDTWIVVSEGSRLTSAIVRSAENIFDTADDTPNFNSSNVVSSNGIANALKNVRADGRIKQESSPFLNKSGTGYSLNTHLSARNGDTIIITLIDNNNVLTSGSSLALYHGRATVGVPYTNIPIGVPTEITLDRDVDDFYLSITPPNPTKSGYITLQLEYKDIYATKSEVDELADDVEVLKTKCEIPFDNIISLNGSVSTTYDTGITLQAGQEIEVTLIDAGGIVTEESLPLYSNSISGSYVNLVPGVPTNIKASEQTHYLLYVASSWISASGNITLHVEYVNTSNIIDVVLPSKVYAYVGGEFNIYNENVAYITQKDRYYVFWSINDIADYKVYSNRLRLMPTDEMIGTHTVTLQVWDRYNITMVYSQSFTLEVVANSAVSNKKVLFIGDSLTNAGYYPYYIEALSNNGIESIGTRTTEVYTDEQGHRTTVNHEGRGGWSARDYVRNYPNYKTDYENPFWNPTANKFDFSYYMTQQGYSTPDAVFINLGTNDVGFLKSQVNAIKEMITSIHAYNNTIPIFVHLINPPATQDGWAYTGHGNSYSFDASARAERKEYLEEFENQIENVYITPMYLNIDRYYDYATVEEQVSQRVPTMVIRQANNVHPSRYGYYKFADVYYADLMNILS